MSPIATNKKKLISGKNLVIGFLVYLGIVALLSVFLLTQADQTHENQMERIPQIIVSLRTTADEQKPKEDVPSEKPSERAPLEEQEQPATPESDDDSAPDQEKDIKATDSKTESDTDAKDITTSDETSPPIKDSKEKEQQPSEETDPDQQDEAPQSPESKDPESTVQEKEAKPSEISAESLAKVKPPEYPKANRPAVAPGPITLPPAPLPGLIQETPQGQALPRKALDGREPWRSYARPFDQSDPRPRISLIISDMGLSANTTRKAIQNLPGEVTLAFVPYAKNLAEWMNQARSQGHETVLAIPMEPNTYPKDDPGPNALLTSLDKSENISRLHWAMARSSGYLGIMNFMGSRFTSSTDAMSPVIEDLKRRGLLIVDSASTAESVIPSLSRIHGVPYVQNDRYIDNIVTRQAIDKQLSLLESIARKKGHAVGVAFPYPITFERINKWIATLDDKNIVLAPLSAVASKEIE